MRVIPDRDRYRKWYLDEDIVHTLHNGHVLKINKGFRFDAHSVPRPFRWIFPQYDTDIYAALIHDALVDLAPWHRYPRKFIDKEYKVLMKEHSHGMRSFWMPLAVTIYGYLVYTMWGDHRGDYSKHTSIEVSVHMV